MIFLILEINLCHHINKCLKFYFYRIRRLLNCRRKSCFVVSPILPLIHFIIMNVDNMWLVFIVVTWMGLERLWELMKVIMWCWRWQRYRTQFIFLPLIIILSGIWPIVLEIDGISIHLFNSWHICLQYVDIEDVKCFYYF